MREEVALGGGGDDVREEVKRQSQSEVYPESAFVFSAPAAAAHLSFSFRPGLK